MINSFVRSQSQLALPLCLLTRSRPGYHVGRCHGTRTSPSVLLVDDMLVVNCLLVDPVVSVRLVFAFPRCKIFPNRKAPGQQRSNLPAGQSFPGARAPLYPVRSTTYIHMWLSGPFSRMLSACTVTTTYCCYRQGDAIFHRRYTEPWVRMCTCQTERGCW